MNSCCFLIWRFHINLQVLKPRSRFRLRPLLWIDHPNVDHDRNAFCYVCLIIFTHVLYFPGYSMHLLLERGPGLNWSA